MAYGNDTDYFRHRVAQEQEHARVAPNGAIRRLHLDFAERYERRVAETERRLDITAPSLRA
ncbi:hypothetical protein [Sphingomonas endophytica]|uniref:Uncharacterized protein n=1 Tax=Sphingomonas endophytica TaxID=869719 RepID=A0A147I8J4_9SPHN|nr:hypothetical protein [Sphingomonas endophytica]KTT75356.1 hypothetical protein NS334_03675 [Sphingomonas endophytica]